MFLWGFGLFFFLGGGGIHLFILICGKNFNRLFSHGLFSLFMPVLLNHSLYFSIVQMCNISSIHLLVLLFSECFFRPVKDSPNKYWNEMANHEQDCPPSLVYRPDICVCGNPLKSDTERKAIAAPTISTLKFTMFQKLYP